MHSGGTNRADVPCASYHSIILYSWLVRKHENRGRNFYIKLTRYENNSAYRKNSKLQIRKGKGKVIPLQARCGPEGGWRYSSTLP